MQNWAAASSKQEPAGITACTWDGKGKTWTCLISLLDALWSQPCQGQRFQSFKFCITLCRLQGCNTLQTHSYYNTIYKVPALKPIPPQHTAHQTQPSQCRCCVIPACYRALKYWYLHYSPLTYFHQAFSILRWERVVPTGVKETIWTPLCQQVQQKKPSK